MTALGINNSGELIFPYGKEDSDYNIKDDPNSNFIFNGAASTFWCRLRNLCANEITSMYSRVNSKCFSSTDIIKEFDDYQNCYPEEIWRLDIERKYIRPFEGTSYDNSVPKQDATYLRAMMQGRKKYQRRQWIRNQEVYFNTMNSFGPAFDAATSEMQFRFYQPQGEVAVAPQYAISIVPYQDMYVAAQLGTGGIRKRRAYAGEAVELEFPHPGAQDTQAIIYGAQRIQAINDISACYVSLVQVGSAKKLKKLVLGNHTEGFYNNRLTDVSSVTNLEMLEELDITNIMSLSGALDFSRCQSLTKLYASGTNISGVQFARNGKLQIAHLPDTVSTLVMRNLNNLEDFQYSTDYLAYLTLEGGNLDNKQLIMDTLDTLKELSMYEIDWTHENSIPDTSMLNAIFNFGKDKSILTGEIHIDSIVRQRELDNYYMRWGDDLVVSPNPDIYDPPESGIRATYEFKFINPGDLEHPLYIMWVDAGVCFYEKDEQGNFIYGDDNKPILIDEYDPVKSGEISTPVLPSSDKYTYTYTGWSEFPEYALQNEVIIAQYEATPRLYSINWYSGNTLLRSETSEFGRELVYDEIPLKTDEEASGSFNLFSGWDKSTGFIREDLRVNAKWNSAIRPSGMQLKDMTPAQVYSIAKSGMSTSRFQAKDYIDINMGRDFTFSNIESEVIAENEYFDGTRYVDKDIQLFSSEMGNFTIAIDFEYLETKGNATLFSCYENDGAEGFRLYYDYNSGGPAIQWGDDTKSLYGGKNRNIIVIRHLINDPDNPDDTTSKKLYVYAFNEGQEGYYSYDENNVVTKTQLTRTRETNVDSIITLGSIRFKQSNRHDQFGKGWIHWCKIWYDDLGEYNCKQLASWPHETIRMDYTSKQGYYISDEQGYSSGYRSDASFICNHALNLGYVQGSENWNTSSMRGFLQKKFYNGLPLEWQTMIQQVQVNSIATSGSYGNYTTSTITTNDKVYLACNYELMQNGQYLEYHIPWFTSNVSRIKFRDIVLPDGYTQNVITTSTDPTSLDGYDISNGTIWLAPVNYYYYYYIYQDAETAAKNSYFLDGYVYSNSATHIDASDGGLWVLAAQWAMRDKYENSNSWYTINHDGNITTVSGSSGYAIVPMFEIGRAR